MGKREKGFTAEHMAALQEGATRRRQEQIVGHYIHNVNPVLFSELLIEALKPRGAALWRLETAFRGSQQAVKDSAPFVNPVKPRLGLPSDSLEDRKDVFIPPTPPRMDIL